MGNNERSSIKKYVYIVMIISSGLLLVCAGINWGVNPYGIWETKRINGINAFVNVTGYERLYKMIQIPKHENANVLFLGSSTVKKALYPQTYFKLTGMETYNAAFDAAQICEMKQEVEQAIRFNPKLKEIVIGLNWFMFHVKYEGVADNFPSGQVGTRLPSILLMGSFLCSMDALKDSIDVIKKNRTGEYWYNVIDDDGKMNVHHLEHEYETSTNIEQFSIDTIGHIPLFKACYLSEKNMEEYASIVELCKRNDIKVKVFINPVHSIFLESIYTAGVGEKFENWKRQLALIHPVYDFAHYSLIGNEPFSVTRKYWRNTQHEMPLTGDLVLMRLTDKTLPDEVGEFGLLLTKENVEEVLARERKLREHWRNNNPQIVQFVEEIIKRY